MGAECLAHAELEEFADGILDETARESAEAHLAQCLSCAETLERMTSSRLERLVFRLNDPAAWPPPASPVLMALMNHAAQSVGDLMRTDLGLDQVLELLDAPLADGSLGTFAGYDILEIAGQGSMGVVLQARDHTLDRVVALKILFPARAHNEEFAERVLAEARTVASVAHDHIVAVHQAGVAKGLPFLVMPFHVEGTLDRILTANVRLDPMEVGRIGLQLARALQATHARDILHRDIKPSNILLEDGRTHVRLADFGLAQSGAQESRNPEDRTSAGSPGSTSLHPRPDEKKPAPRTIAGTPHYMSPEQARGEPLDGRSDLFSLGAVLYQLATGRTVHAGESSREVLQAAVRCELKPVRTGAPELPRALAAIIDRLLARRPEDRFASAADAARALDRFVHRKDRLLRRIKRAAVALCGVGFLGAATVLALDASGRTAIINTLWCQRTGDVYYARGRFGTYPSLAEAVAHAGRNDVIEVRFSGERSVAPFRLGGKPLTIRAAPGFNPILVAKNNAEAMILADGPLNLEGLTLWRRGPQSNFALLISSEGAPLHMLNCRVLRSRHPGQDIVRWGRLRVSPDVDSRRYRALLGFQHGSLGRLRNCVIAGTQTAAVEFRASASQPTRVDVRNCLVLTDVAFYLNREATSGLSLRSTESVFVTGALLDLRNTDIAGVHSFDWADCIVDRAGGALTRLEAFGNGAGPRAIEWRETNMIHLGRGAWLADRRGHEIRSEEEWNVLMRLTAGPTRFVEQQAFPETCVRSCLTLSATDMNRAILESAPSDRPGHDPDIVGEGVPYERFRRTPAYRAWQEEVRASVRAWEERFVTLAERR